MSVEPTAVRPALKRVEPATIITRTKGRERELPTALWLAGIVLVSAAVRLAIAATVPVPAIFPDEFVYWELARGIADSGQLLIRDEAVTAWSFGPLYPLLISPVHVLAGSLVDAYALAKAVNAVLMSLAAVPAYFLARRVVSPRASLAAAALAVLVPSGVYATRIMSENLSYPLFLWAMVAMTAALERPSVRRQLFAVGVIALAALARPQLFILLPAFASAISVLAWLDARDGRGASFRAQVRAFRPTWVIAGSAAALVFALAAVGSLGPHVALIGNARPLEVPRNLVWHLAELDIYSGIIPFSAFLLAAGTTFRLTSANGARRRFGALSISTAAWAIALAAVYESGIRLYGVFDAHVFDRYVFYVVPFFAIALLAWIEDGLPRPRALTTGVAAVAVFLPLTLPLGSLLHGREWGTCTCTVGLVPLAWVKALLGEGWALKGFLLAVTGLLVLIFLRIHLERRWVLVRVAALVFLLFGLMVTFSNAKLSRDARAQAGDNVLSWVDTSVGPAGRVAILWRGNNSNPPPERLALREAEFFNRSIGPVYDLQDPLSGDFPSTDVTVNRGRVATSAGRDVRAQYVLTHRGLIIAGQPVARDAGSGLVLYRIRGAITIVR